MDAIPEIPVDHHLNMLDWAAYQALCGSWTWMLGRDALADKFAQRFEAHVVEAKKEAMTQDVRRRNFGRLVGAVGHMRGYNG